MSISGKFEKYVQASFIQVKYITVSACLFINTRCRAAYFSINVPITLAKYTHCWKKKRMNTLLLYAMPMVFARSLRHWRNLQ